jgi:hypothetical protein
LVQKPILFFTTQKAKSRQSGRFRCSLLSQRCSGVCAACASSSGDYFQFKFKQSFNFKLKIHGSHRDSSVNFDQFLTKNWIKIKRPQHRDLKGR